MDMKLSKHLCGFRKGYSDQHSLLVMLGKWSFHRYGGCFGHDLLTSKIAANGFDHNATQLIHSYLTNRRQRVRIN